VATGTASGLLSCLFPSFDGFTGAEGEAGPPDGSAGDAHVGDAGADAPSDATPDVQGTCDANLDDSSTNCGRCGHDCLGGACVDSVCRATSLVAIQATAIALHDGFLYFSTSDGTVSRRALTSPQPVVSTIATSTVGAPSALAVDDLNVYWTVPGDPDGGTGHVFCAPADGGGAPFELSNQQNLPMSIAAFGGRIYWANFGVGANDAHDGSIWSCSMADGGACMSPACKDQVALVNNVFGPGSLSAVPSLNYMMWTTANSPDIDGDPRYFSLPATAVNTAVTSFTPGVHAGSKEITSDPMGANAFWTSDNDTGQIVMHSFGGQGASLEGAPISAPIGIAVDGTDVYWANYGRPMEFADGGGDYASAGAYRMPRSAFPQSDLATLDAGLAVQLYDGPVAGPLLADDTSIYFITTVAANREPTGIYRVAK
jgi:hypothetical protein